MGEINAGAPRGEAHSFSSSGRRGMHISGVRDVISFDEGGVVVLTECGNMAVEGEGLHVTVLNVSDGIVELNGTINGLYYFEDKPSSKKGFFRKRTDGE